MDVLRRGLLPRQIVTRGALENAIAGVNATGGSTNAVLHLLAIAREAGVPLTIDDFDPDRPAHAAVGRHAARREVHRRRPRAGRRNRRSSRKRLVDARLVDGEAVTVTGRTFAEEAARARETPGPGRRVAARPADQADRRPRHPEGLARARGLRREGRRTRAPAASRPGPASSSARRTPWPPCWLDASGQATSS